MKIKIKLHEQTQIVIIGSNDHNICKLLIPWLAAVEYKICSFDYENLRQLLITSIVSD